MAFKEILEISAAVATIFAGVIAVGGAAVAWRKWFFHNLHGFLKHHAQKIQKEKDENNG
jgi:hypothetical protein